MERASHYSLKPVDIIKYSSSSDLKIENQTLDLTWTVQVETGATKPQSIYLPT